MIVLVPAAVLVAIGMYGVLTRRDIVAILACIEVMMAGAMLLLVGLPLVSAFAPLPADGAVVEARGVIVLVVAAAEAAVGLALLVVVAQRRGATRIDEIEEGRG